jgi:hypothetical protein
LAYDINSPSEAIDLITRLMQLSGVSEKNIISLNFEERENIKFSEWTALYDEIIARLNPNEKTFEREFSSLRTIRDSYPKYVLTLDYDNAIIDGIQKILENLSFSSNFASWKKETTNLSAISAISCKWFFPLKFKKYPSTQDSPVPTVTEPKAGEVARIATIKLSVRNTLQTGKR